MIKKRLTRELKWCFQGFPYYQMRMDIDDFHGLVSLIRMPKGEYRFWELKKAGKFPVCGEGMLWLQLIPDHTHRVITAMIMPKSKNVAGHQYDKTVSVWYVDVIDSWDYDEDKVAYFMDQYLDVVFTPEGDVCLCDEDELKDALVAEDITKEQYDRALREGELIKEDLCKDIMKTQDWCIRILGAAWKRIKNHDRVLVKNERNF